MKNLLSIVLLLSVVFTSCKDEEPLPDPTPLTTAEKLQHKWNIVSFIDYNYKGATTELDNTDTLDIGVGAYCEFRTDDKVYWNFEGDLDTTSYQIINDNAISFGGDAFTITTLTTNSLKLKYEERTDTPYYDNVLTFDR